MKLRNFRVHLAVLISAVLVLGLVIPSFANGTTGTESTGSQSFQRLALDNGSYIQLEELTWLTTGDERVVRFTFDIHNGGLTNISFFDYWVRLKTKSGLTLPVNQIAEDQNKIVIPPQSKVSFTFYGSISANIPLEDLYIDFIKWDFSQPNYERSLGQIKFPEQISMVTPWGASKVVNLGRTPLSVRIDKFSLSETTEQLNGVVALNIINKGTRSVKLPEYLYYLRSDDGVMYALQPQAREEEEGTPTSGVAGDNSLQPLTEFKLELKATLPKLLENAKWQLVVVNAEGEPAVELPRALFELVVTDGSDEGTDEPLTVVEPDARKEIKIEDIPLQAYVDKMNVKKEKQEEESKENRREVNRVTIGFNFENMGNKAVKLPEYHYYLVTADGLEYPLFNEYKEVGINPRVAHTVDLTVDLPVAVSVNNMQLVVRNKPKTSKGTGKIWGVFALRISDEEVETPRDAYPIGVEYEYKTKEGLYGVQLVGINRLPWDDKDIISAEIKITNKDFKALPIPSFAGQFKLDQIKLDTSILSYKEENVYHLPKGSSTYVMLYMKVPYTYDFDEIQVVLQEKAATDSDKPKTITEFYQTASAPVIPVVDADTAYEITDVGNRAEITLKSSRIYRSSGSNMIYGEVEMVNMEKRQTKAPVMTGYLRSEDGSYFPVVLQAVEQQVSPGGKVLLAMHSILPSSVSTSNVEFVLGELVEFEGEKTIVKASAFQLPSDNGTSAKDGFEQIEIKPYTFTMKDLQIHMSTNAKLQFNYTLEKSTSGYMVLPEGHKLMIELVDGETPYTQTFSFEEDLKIGTHQGQMVAEMNIINLNDKLEQFSGFEVKVYDVYQGYKRLMASQMVHRLYTGSE